MTNTFKVNDIIHHKQLGLMILVEERSNLVNQTRLTFGLHGTPLFNMIRLVSNDINRWVLHDSSLHKVRLATDDDIVKELADRLCTINLDDKIQLSFCPESEAIHLSGDADDFIWLEKPIIKLLKKYLKELNV